MFKKIFLLFLQLNNTNSLKLPKAIGSFFISSSLMNNNMNQQIILPKNTNIINKISEITENISNIKINNNDIYFYGPINSQSCQELSEILLTLNTNAKIFSVNFGIDPPPINLHIQSEGGSLLNAFYVADLINNLETPVYTFIDGYTASAGSLISVMGKKRFMTKNSFIMIHQLSSSLGEGKFNDLDDNMINLNKFMETITNIYLEKTKIPINTLKNILEHDLWMNSDECVNYGLVDKII
jgi:ATP-dependent Clp protease protease subunit